MTKTRKMASSLRSGIINMPAWGNEEIAEQTEPKMV